jgi:hypothetical protein
MRVQINVHGDKDVSADAREDIEATLRDRLVRFDGLFTRLEVHVTPNDAAGAGMNVFLCGIEARAAGKTPIKVHHAARRVDLAAEGAVVKLITATERRVARKRTVTRKGHAR